jgi:hypothetical protein
MRWAIMVVLLIVCSAPFASLPHAQEAGGTRTGQAGATHGNAANDLLLAKHLAAGLKCSACHKDNPPKTPANDAVCLTCHGPLSALIAKTAADAPNPHAQAHIGPIPCTACHHVHAPSESYCNKCHSFDMTVP